MLSKYYKPKRYIDLSYSCFLSPHDGASVLACAYQLKVRSQNPKDFEHWFSQRLWVKFAMFLLNSTSVDAGAI